MHTEPAYSLTKDWSNGRQKKVKVIRREIESVYRVSTVPHTVYQKARTSFVESNKRGRGKK